MSTYDILAGLFLLAALFLFVNLSYLKLPTSVGLMILALVLSAVVIIVGEIFPEYHLAEKVKEYHYADILYRFVLSVMLFAAGLSVDFKKLGKQFVPVLMLAFLGVLISTFVIGGLLYALLDMMNIELSFMGCLVFGALISSTDPVAITKTLQRFNLSKQLETKITGESMLNGGIAIVLAMILVRIQEYDTINSTTALSDNLLLVLRNVGGGLLLGLFFGWVGYKTLSWVDNDSIEVEVLVTLSLVMTGSYFGNLFNTSPMLIAIVSGLMIANYGQDESEDTALGKYVYRFWKLMQETIAAILFVLIGFEMIVIPLRMDYFAAGFFTVLIVLIARWISVYVPIKLLSSSHAFDKGTVSVLTWGALRGGLPVAVSLSLHNFPGEELIVTLTYTVVVCSVLYQGLTLSPMMKLYRGTHKG